VVVVEKQEEEVGFGMCGERDGEEEEQDLLEVRRRWGLLSQEVGLQKLLDTLSHLR